MEIRTEITIGKKTAQESFGHTTRRAQEQTEWEKRFTLKTGLNFNLYYEKFYPKLVWHMKGFKITDLDAEDLANQAFMKTLDKIETYDPQWEFSTWLFKIATNMALQYKKKQQRDVYVTMEEPTEDEWTPLHSHIQHKLIDDSIDNSEYEARVAAKYKAALREIMNLPEKYRQCIELCDIQGKSYNEIMDLTGYALHTVKNRIFHGRSILGKELNQALQWMNRNI